MAEYYGLRAIAARMSVDRATIWRWQRTNPPFLMFRRRLHRRPMWYTNDALIFAWERERCRKDAPPLLPPTPRKKRVQS